MPDGVALMRGKRIQFDDETWHALDLLARDLFRNWPMRRRDLLHGRPTDLRTALRQSAKKIEQKPKGSAKLSLS
jgi:hypothetical protein